MRLNIPKRPVFIYVNDDKLEDFKTTYMNADSKTKYDNSIAFLGTTGQIYAKGNIYGANNKDIVKLQESLEGIEELLAKING